MQISFTAFGNPIGKGRPRVVRLPSGKVHTFTPDRTAAWEQSIRVQALAHRPDKPLEGPLVLVLTFYLVKPSSAKRRKYPHVRPDADNLLKACLDALNGLMWRDDAQIVDLIAQKWYGDPPRVEIIIQELEEAST